jgi:hypothetical protein
MYVFRHRTNCLLAACLFVFMPVGAFAQICRGSADVSTAQRWHGGASGTFAEVGNGIYGVVAGGSTAYVIAGRAGMEDYRGAHFFRTRLEGAPQLAAFSRRLVVCPGGTLSTGKTYVFERHRFEWTLGMAASVGVVAIDRTRIQAIPAFTFVVERWRARTWYYIYEDKLTSYVWETVSWGEAAVGIVLNRRVSITPSVRFRTDQMESNRELTNAFHTTFTVRIGG